MENKQGKRKRRKVKINIIDPRLFGARLSMVRAHLKLTQEEVADELQIDRQTYGKYEAFGHMNMGLLKTFIDLANKNHPDLFLNSEFFFNEKADLNAITAEVQGIIGISDKVLANLKRIKSYNALNYENPNGRILDNNQIRPIDTLNMLLSHKSFYDFIIRMTHIKNDNTEYFHGERYADYERQYFTLWKKDKIMQDFIREFLTDFNPVPTLDNYEYIDEEAAEANFMSNMQEKYAEKKPD